MKPSDMAVPMDGLPIDEVNPGNQAGMERQADPFADGCQKLGSFPLTSEFWTKKPQHGQA